MSVSTTDDAISCPGQEVAALATAAVGDQALGVAAVLWRACLDVKKIRAWFLYFLCVVLWQADLDVQKINDCVKLSLSF